MRLFWHTGNRPDEEEHSRSTVQDHLLTLCHKIFSCCAGRPELLPLEVDEKCPVGILLPPMWPELSSWTSIIEIELSHVSPH